jgi:hypothetical protein
MVAVIECETSDSNTPGEIALFDVTSGSSTQIGIQDITTISPSEITIGIPASASPGDDRIFELRARVDSFGADGEKCIILSAHISIE